MTPQRLRRAAPTHYGGRAPASEPAEPERAARPARRIALAMAPPVKRARAEIQYRLAGVGGGRQFNCSRRPGGGVASCAVGSLQCTAWRNPHFNRRSHIRSAYAHIGAAESGRIGRGVSIASSVYISDHDHDWCDPGEPAILNERLRTAAVEIGDFVWLGERAIVLKGVTIGAYSVIGAGSIVTRDVPPYTLAVGAPARVIRRYDHERRLWTPVKQ